MIILGYLNITRMHSPDCAWPRVSPLLMMPPTAHYTLQTPHWHWGIPVTPGDLEGRLGLTPTLTPSSTCHQSGFRTCNMIGAGSPLTHCHHGCDRQWTANTDNTCSGMSQNYYYWSWCIEKWVVIWCRPDWSFERRFMKIYNHTLQVPSHDWKRLQALSHLFKNLLCHSDV